MRAASYSSSSYRGDASLRSRAVAFLLALALTALIVVMLVRLGALPGLTAPAAPVTLQLLPDRPTAPAASRIVAHSPHPSHGGSPPRPVPKPPAAPPAPTAPVPPLNILFLSKAEMAAADIGKMPSRRPDAVSGGDGTSGMGAGSASGDDAGTGNGPGGDRLYDAQWYTKPTDAEMATYMPARAIQGWGLIACRTIANYRVEDCRELDESPAGSGLSRALREAAWQFRVLPPRIGGHAMVGAWVRIRFDFLLKAS